MKLKETVYTILDKGMDTVLSKGWTFDKVSKVSIVALSMGLMFTTLTKDKEVEEVDTNPTIVYAEELEKPEVKNVTVDEVEEVKETEEGGLGEVKHLWESGFSKEQVEFLHKVAPEAIVVAEKYNVYPSVIVAQAILESDWGQSELAVEANNYFGVKGSYESQSYKKVTKEDDGSGVQYEVIADFAKYPSVKESIESNAKLVREGASFDAEYYKGAWVENASDYKQATKALTGTYATDIHYNKKVNGVIEDNNLEELDNILYK